VEGSNAPFLLPAPSPLLQLAPGPVESPPPLLASGQPAIAGLLPAPSPATQRELGLAQFLDDLQAELDQRAGVLLDVGIIPRDGVILIQLPAAEGRSIFRIKLALDILTFAPTQRRDRYGLPVSAPDWRKQYFAPPDRDALFDAINARVVRHNAKGGYFAN
jgi:hypothetical protein